MNMDAQGHEAISNLEGKQDSASGGILLTTRHFSAGPAPLEVRRWPYSDQTAPP